MRRDRGRSESIALETSMLCMYSCPAIPWHMLSLCLREVDSGCGVETQWIFSSSLLQCHLHVWHFKGWPWAVLGAVSEPEVLKMNHWMAKSAWQKKTPCHRNREKNLFGGLFLNGRLGSVENSTNYVALCEFPLALGHDMQKKKKKKRTTNHTRKGMKTLFIILFLSRAQKLCVLQVPRFFAALQPPTQIEQGQELDAHILCILDVRLWKIYLWVVQMVTSLPTGSCIPIVYSVFLILTYLISQGSGQHHLKPGWDFFYLTKAGFHFSNFLFVAQTMQKEMAFGAIKSIKTESNAHLGWKYHASNSFLLQLL